ncbi:cob(I)yrinic acid a,c-diamide adenosyltransferase [Alteromonas halophila]|uniref:Corrinoid adenosyltransferase n=1 Tax=Alteromonas halophila TaxID=516698 RepID=A0A918MVM1_9ALTE|nr:cob(I)yrinic acid a,c-diamide adenosyltransferase [Alteromonas halophila]GGW76464.1 cobalamin adenosyltransferase [Alteromonas halophila]
MKIYTRKGDQGTTQVYVDKPMRVDKDNTLLAAYGDIDELNSHLGLLANFCHEDECELLANIQRNLFQVGFAISASSSLSQASITTLEEHIDTLQDVLPPQSYFILPGGCQAAAQAHVCRAVCRRAERTITTLRREHDVPDMVVMYLNRLSDYLYTLARHLNFTAGVADTRA